VKKILIPTAEQIVFANKYICEQDCNAHHCYGVGKIESAIHTAFYPGTYPFAAGGLARVAGALCFYLVRSHAFMDGNKRVGALSAIAFLNENGWDLQYPIDDTNRYDALAEIIEACAAGKVTKEQLMDWFDNHKARLPDLDTTF
jgi:death on curing protein